MRSALAWLLWREATDLWRNRRLFVGVVVLPLLLAVALAPGLTWVVSRTEEAVGHHLRVTHARQEILGVKPQGAVRPQESLPVAMLDPRLVEEPAGRQMVWLMVYIALNYILLFPLVLPLSTGSAAIIQERADGTLEPLLTAPIATRSVLLAKVLIAVGPPVLITWIAWGIQMLVAIRALPSVLVRTILLAPGWLVAVFVVAPLLSLLMALLLVVLSARLPDARTAQQWSALLVTPFLGLQLSALMGVTRLDVGLASLLPILLLAVPLALRAADRAFARATILARRL